MQRSEQLLTLLLDHKLDQGYYSDPAKSLFTCDSSDKEVLTRRSFEGKGNMIKFVLGIWYSGAFVGPWEAMEVWVTPQVETWAEGVRLLAKFGARHPQTAYSELGTSFQLE